MHASRFTLPPGHHVRYDFHDRPRGVSAIVLEGDRIRSVGFAKFNPNDGQYNEELGMHIARGRALAKLAREEAQSRLPRRYAVSRLS